MLVLALAMLVCLGSASAGCSLSGWADTASGAVANPQTSATGTIGFSGYRDDQNCYRAISVIPDAASMSISFSSFNTENNYDKLYIYDGVSTSDVKLLNAHSGTSTPAGKQSTNAVVLFRFTSDGSITRTGFTATWTASCLAGAYLSPSTRECTK
jgi:hypothetical protein